MSNITPRSERGQQGFWPSLFEPFWTAGQQIAGLFHPKADASRDEGAYQVTMELPGVSEDDIDVSLDGDILTVRGEKKSEHEEKKADYYFSERSYGVFQRSFQLPKDVDREKIAANCENGLLTLTLPRREVAGTSTQKISVNKG